MGRQAEAKEQKILAHWLDGRFPGFWFHTPNGGKREGNQAFYLKLEGLKPGIPDVIINVPFTYGRTYNGCVWELKKKHDKWKDKSPPSKTQRRQLMMYKFAGYFTGVSWGAASTIEKTKELYGDTPLPDLAFRPIKVCWGCMYELHHNLAVKGGVHKCTQGGTCQSTIRVFNSLDEVYQATKPKPKTTKAPVLAKIVSPELITPESIHTTEKAGTFIPPPTSQHRQEIPEWLRKK